MKNNQFSNAQQRWSLRKLSVGVCSVLLGMALLGAGSVASADTTTAAQPQTTAVAVQPSATTRESYDQNPVVPNNYATALQGFRPGQTESQNLRNVSQQGIADNVLNPNQPVSHVSMFQHNGGAWQVSYNIKYNSNAADQQETVDPQNLTASQEQEITDFAANTINNIRQKVQSQNGGTSVSAGYLKVSPYATQVGSQIMHQAYDNYSGSGHNTPGLQAAARSHGINAWVGENIGSLNEGLEAVRLKNQGYISNITMDMIKKEIYSNIIAMMYQDYNESGIGAGGHTTALLNDPYYRSGNGGNAIALDSNGNLVANQYLAVTIDKKNQIHFNFISDDGASNEAKTQLAANAVQLGGGNSVIHSGGNANTSNSNWKQVNGKWQYVTNGSAVKSAWRAINGNWYYFDNNGNAVTGLQTINGHVYNFDANNAWALKGWQKVNGSWYYFDNNNTWALTGWQRINGNWYHFGNDGKAATGMQTINGHVYNFDANNAWALTGWQKVNGAWYYFDNSNAWALTGWQRINGNWYYFAQNGKAATGWQKIGGNWYCFDNTNAWALTGWQKINGHWYYFDRNNAWALTGWQKINGAWYYFDKTNAWALTGWQKINGAWYYFDNTNAWALTGWQRINNRWYYFDPTNAWALTGWQYLGNKWYYMDPSNAWMDTGWVTVGNTQYYMNAGGDWNGQSRAKTNQSSLTNKQLGAAVALMVNPTWFNEYLNGSMYYGEDAADISKSLSGYHYVTTKGDPTSYIYYKVDNGTVTYKEWIPAADSVANGHMQTRTISLSDLLSKSNTSTVTSDANKIKNA